MKHVTKPMLGGAIFEDFYAPVCSISGGGSSGSQQSAQQATQGFRDLPPEIQNAFKDLSVQAQGFLPGNNPAATQMFRPTPQSAGETQAIGNINQGFTPNATQFQSDINMQMNPFDSSVIDQINRQAQGQNSILKQNLNSAGQFGSNRGFLGANDIDLSRLQQIGQFKQGQFNTAANNALTIFPQNRLSDANAQLSAGGFQRGLAGQTAQAPISNLESIAKILGILPTNSGQSSGNSSGSQSGFNFGLFSSDMAVKENIIPAGIENGWPVYEFNFIGDERKYIGVMAQDVESVMPEAVKLIDGIKVVDYGMIGVRFRNA